MCRIFERRVRKIVRVSRDVYALEVTHFSALIHGGVGLAWCVQYLSIRTSTKKKEDKKNV